MSTTINTISFGTYQLNKDNGIYNAKWREMQGAERFMTTLRVGGKRGLKVLNSTLGGKVVELTGQLIASDIDALVLKVRQFVTEMLKEGQPVTVVNSEGSFVYDDVYVTNTNEITALREFCSQSFVDFRVVFLCPKGFARSIAQTIQSTSDITTLPYTGSITIAGDTSPEPIIEITLTDASTFTDLFFTNLTTNMEISVTGLTLADGDVISFDTENKTVLHNATQISFDGIFPDFVVGVNNYSLTGAGDAALIKDQSAYNSEVNVYGNNRAGEKITFGGSDNLSQVKLLIKKVTGIQTTISLYDDFNDNTENNSKFTYTGTHVEEGSMVRVGRKDGSGSGGMATTSGHNSTATGFEWYHVGHPGGSQGSGTSGENVYVQLADSNGTIGFRCYQYITHIYGTGAYSGIGTYSAGISGTFKAVQDGSLIKIYENGTLRLSMTATFASNLYWTIGADSNLNDNFYIEADNLYLYYTIAATSNTDLIFRIETDNAGSPSGTAVANSTVTIPVGNIAESFGDLIISFATQPAVSATVFHPVVYQTGGDINNYYVLKKQNTDVLANANLETSANGGTSWTQVTGEDLFIQVWNAFPTNYSLNLIIRYFASYFNIG
jgi:phage-related protein